MVVNLYAVKNIINGKIYIGKTVKTIWRRFSQHKKHARRIKGRGSHMPICRALRKYPLKSFVLVDLGFCLSNKSACLAERELIKHWRKQHCGVYNATDGGDGLIGYVFTKKHRRKLGLANKRRFANGGHPFLGKRLTLKHRQAVARGVTRLKHSEAVKRRIAASVSKARKAKFWSTKT